MKIIISILLVLAVVLSMTSCKKKRIKLERETIEEYIAENNLDAEVTSEGVYYVINQVGNGVSPNLSDQVEVTYAGTLLDGTPFDGGRTSFPLAAVIKGWQIGIPQFSEGGSGLLIIPSRHAYGKNPPPGGIIGKNEILVFSVTLHDVF